MSRESKDFDSAVKKTYVEFLLIFLISVFIFVFLITFFFKPFTIEGKSMEPLFREGDVVLVRRFFLRIDKNDIVVVKLNDNSYAVKRVIATEGDKVEYKEGKIFVNGENRGKIDSGDYRMFFENSFFVVEKNCLFLLGDNRSCSVDSRFWGSIPIKMIHGKVFFNLFSFLRRKRV